MAKYDELMGRIEVTDEMRARILRGVGDAMQKPAPVVRFPRWKTYLTLAACFAVIVLGAVAVPTLTGSDPAPSGSQVLAVPGVTEAASTEELSALVGFSMTEIPSLAKTADETAYLAFGGELAEIRYTIGGQQVDYRKSVGTDDNSGDYTAYPAVLEVTVQENDVTLKGGADGYQLAVWTDGEYAYSIRMDSAVTADALEQLAGEAGSVN
ncbi:MAG: hypothetical protein ACI4PD_07815 [Butyricicoccus sp.]